MRSEVVYQSKLIKRLQTRFPDSVVLKNDPSEIQGIPDLLILFRNRWAMLEVKRSESEPRQPNQEYYVSLFNQMSFAAFVFPLNEDWVFDALEEFFYQA